MPTYSLGLTVAWWARPACCALITYAWVRSRLPFCPADLPDRLTAIGEKIYGAAISPWMQDSETGKRKPLPITKG